MDYLFAEESESDDIEEGYASMAELCPRKQRKLKRSITYLFCAPFIMLLRSSCLLYIYIYIMNLNNVGWFLY